MPDCKWMQDEICVNADCPACADYCPVPDYPGVCRFDGVNIRQMNKIVAEEYAEREAAKAFITDRTIAVKRGDLPSGAQIDAVMRGIRKGLTKEDVIEALVNARRDKQ